MNARSHTPRRHSRSDTHHARAHALPLLVFTHVLTHVLTYLKVPQNPGGAAQTLLQPNDVADDDLPLGHSGSRVAAILGNDVIVLRDLAVADAPLSFLKFLISHSFELGIVDQTSVPPSAHLENKYPKTCLRSLRDKINYFIYINHTCDERVYLIINLDIGYVTNLPSTQQEDIRHEKAKRERGGGMQ